METNIAVAIFVVAFALIINERIHRTTAALVGAMLMVMVGIEGYAQEQAFDAIDFNVIFLLVGMMIIVNVLSRTGVFQWLSLRAAKSVGGHGIGILVALSAVTAIASAFLDNVTTVILIAPVTLILADALQIRPTPILVSQAMASNIGGAATLVGDPPNLIISSAADLTFVDFIANMLPISLITLVPALALVAWLSRDSLKIPEHARTAILNLDDSQIIAEPRLLRITLGILLLTVIGFIVHGVLDLEPATIALAGAALLLLVVGEDPEKTLREVEWSTVFFFVGLFIMVGGLEAVGVFETVSEEVISLSGNSVSASAFIILWVSGLLSGFVDNIPYTAAMIPVVADLEADLDANRTLWWALAIGADFGGNLTIIGASANVYIANLAARGGEPISFWEFTRYGLPVTLLSLALASAYLWLRYLM